MDHCAQGAGLSPSLPRSTSFANPKAKRSARTTTIRTVACNCNRISPGIDPVRRGLAFFGQKAGFSYKRRPAISQHGDKVASLLFGDTRLFNQALNNRVVRGGAGCSVPIVSHRKKVPRQPNATIWIEFLHDGFRDHGITRIAKVGIIQRQRTPNRLAGARQAPRQLLVPAILCSNLDRRALLATLECLHLPAGHRYSLVWARIRLQAHPFGGHANGT